jgi:two-component system sensor histidine kinase BaeS
MSGAVALVVAGVLGDQLGRRIARPLQDAELATRRIADGDLSATVTVEPGADAELESLARSINTMASTLARSKDVERQFLMSVSHDLRTPLTSIRGFAEAIADGAAPDDRRAAEVIGAESRRLERLVGDLLDLAKLDARQFSLDLRPVDLSGVVAATADGFSHAAAEYGIGLNVDVPPVPVLVRADPDRLGQVIANVVENALKFASGHIAVRALDGLAPSIVVEDDGPGIPGPDLPLVFGRMYSSSRTPTRQVGSGLGLAIVAELVAAMGGTVRAESPIRVDGGVGGTRVVVQLRSAERAPEPERPS